MRSGGRRRSWVVGLNCKSGSWVSALNMKSGPPKKAGPTISWALIVFIWEDWGNRGRIGGGR